MEKYNGNPVIPNPGLPDFLNPKVLWYEPTKKWIRALAQNDRMKIYTSSNLKKWIFASDFGENDGAHMGMGVWECPDLLKFKFKFKFSYSIYIGGEFLAGCRQLIELIEILVSSLDSF
jgi:sucrose-6-phosphate hydrolase SacC (GH32 family)